MNNGTPYLYESCNQYEKRWVSIGHDTPEGFTLVHKTAPLVHE